MVAAPPATNNLMWVVGVVLLLLLVGIGLSLSKAPASDSFRPVSPEGTDKANLESFSYELDGSTVSQVIQEKDGVHVESFTFSDESPKFLIAYVPKSLATQSSSVQVEGQSLSEYQILVDDPIVSFKVEGKTVSFYVQPDKTAGGDLPRKIRVFSIPYDSRMTKKDLQDIANRIAALPDYAFGEQTFPELQKEVLAVLKSNPNDPASAKLSMDQLVIKYGSQLPVNPSESQPIAETEYLIGAKDPRRINLASSEEQSTEEFYASSTQGGILLSFRLILPAPADEVKHRQDFRLDAGSEKFVESIPIQSISLPQKVRSLNGYAHDFTVLMKLKPSAISGGRFPDFDVTGTLRPLVTGFPDVRNKRIKVVVHFRQSKPFIQAGYFWPGNDLVFQTKPAAVFVTNDFAGGALPVDVCGQRVTVPAQGGYAVPLKPSRSIALAFSEITTMAAKEQAVFDYVFPEGDAPSARKFEFMSVDVAGKETAYLSIPANTLKERTGQFSLTSPKEGTYRVYSTTKVGSKVVKNTLPHTFKISRIYVTKTPRLSVVEKSGVQYCEITQGGNPVTTLVLDDEQNFIPGTLSFSTSYDKDLFCTGMKTVLANLVLVYGNNLKTIDPDTYAAVYGSTHSQTTLLRTAAGMSSCDLIEPFDRIGTIASPQKLEEHRLYVVKLNTDLNYFPQARPYLTLQKISAGDAQTASIFNAPNWKGVLLSSDVKSS